ncbi:MAG: zinc ribbon domain-containing protein [Actinomycetota bacterium]|nr:zinc ribbon domain-containing protein [Actinomycetota bacterium]
MPIYEYRCPKGHLFERIQGFSDPDPAGCDVCGEGPVEKVLYPVAVHFKGSGFYSTDYGRGARKRDGAESGGADSGGGDGAASSEGTGAETNADKPGDRAGGDKPTGKGAET